jgi:hypothetical protein
MKRFAAAAIALLLLFQITGVAVFAASVTLEWDPNDPAPEGYRLFRRHIDGAYDYSSPVATLTGTSYEDECPDGFTCAWVVRAYEGADESGDSNEVSSGTGDNPLPGTPTNIEVIEENGIMYLISAPVPAAQAKGYEIQLDEVRTLAAPAEQVDADNVRLHYDLKTVSNLAEGEHTVRVRALNGWGAGTYTDPFVFTKTLPGVPSGIGLSED